MTKLDNDQDNEDIFLEKYLRTKFKVKLVDIKNINKNDQKDSPVLVRNVWPTEKDNKLWSELRKTWKKNKIKVYNGVYGNADIKGKKYLIHLYKEGYQVIPSIDSIKELNKLKSNKFLIKPLYGSSSKGIEILNKEQIIKRNLKNYIIQPFIDLKKEISFYFIDGKLQYSLYVNYGENRWNLKSFKPDKSQIIFANNFVKWNNLDYGIQRIDACETKEGKLLLMEIEDFCPFLSLQDINIKTRNKFMKNLVKSINKNLY